MEGGGWRVEGGGWRVESGGLRVEGYTRVYVWDDHAAPTVTYTLHPPLSRRHFPLHIRLHTRSEQAEPLFAGGSDFWHTKVALLLSSSLSLYLHLSLSLFISLSLARARSLSLSLSLLLAIARTHMLSQHVTHAITTPRVRRRSLISP